MRPTVLCLSAKTVEACAVRSGEQFEQTVLVDIGEGHARFGVPAEVERFLDRSIQGRDYD
jgi:hypothetical protein